MIRRALCKAIESEKEVNTGEVIVIVRLASWIDARHAENIFTEPKLVTWLNGPQFQYNTK